ncbi:phage tail tape measure protein [Pseudomonas sp. SWRI107]|uniref:phage tail tape measure protein n=1 Tax=Pseudomonas farsensis TaxID=2745492 RepID=UPI0016444C49|nr:phage tail tape measure protein [Pseudomonas farsensis]MBV4534130.1 phage tail tape measure protein [Pseudomonas farsensis]
MARLAIALEIGGAVAASLGAAFGTAKGHIKKLEDAGKNAKVLKNTIGETIKLRDEWKKAHDSGSAAASGLLRRLEGNLDALKKQGVEVGRLAREYQRLGREAKAADLKQKGRQQIEAGKASLKSNIGAAAVGAGMVAIPTKISADYQAIIRDIAIKAGIANKPEEAQLTRTVIDTAQDTGMSRNDVADLVNQLVGAGMELDKALSYAPVAAKFAVGQGASGVDTASMIQALQQNAKITDPRVMQQALEAIAFQGQAGSFEASDMARWFPQLLAGMEKSGSTGLDAVTSLGSMLQVQMKTAGSSDEAANNFKNWIEKIGSGEVVDAYKKAGIDYQASMNTGIQNGMSTIESSMALALKYVEATDPAKAKKIKDGQASISKEADPEKAKAALDALEKSLRTGDLFADMQVKAALTAYSQNRELYAQLKNDSTKATGILDQNLTERRETSAQIWRETLQAVDDSMRSIGDAIRPFTDRLAQGITSVANAFTKLSDGSQTLVAGAVAVAAAFVAIKTAFSAFKIGKGMLNVARGGLLGAAKDKDEVQKVFVTNSEDGEGGGDEDDSGRNKVISMFQKSVRAVTGKGDGDEAEGEEKAGGLDPVDIGLDLLDLFRTEKEKDGEDGGSAEPQKVFVVNASDFGGMGGGESRGRRRRRGGRRSRGAGGSGSSTSRPRARPPVPAPAPVPVPAPASRLSRIGTTATSLLGRAETLAPALAETGLMGKASGLVTKLAKKMPGGNVLDFGMKVYDTATTAETQNEKAEGYGRAAGGLAGSMAGASAGAAIGSVVPVVGSAIGSLIGAVLGGMGGEELGGFLGLKLFGEDEAPAKTEKAPEPGDVARSIAAAAPAPTAPVVAQALEQAKPKGDPPKVDQQFSYMPNMPITVQGDVKDPQQVFSTLEALIRRSWESWSQEGLSRQAAGQLFDEPHL